MFSSTCNFYSVTTCILKLPWQVFLITVKSSKMCRVSAKTLFWVEAIILPDWFRSRTKLDPHIKSRKKGIWDGFSASEKPFAHNETSFGFSYWV